jgi:hypothetical protein
MRADPLTPLTTQVQAELAKFKKTIIYLNDALLYPQFLAQKVI